MIDFPIVDTHVHLWDPSKLRYPWLDDIPLLNKSYLPMDYRTDCRSIDVDKMVFVQCECEPFLYKEEVRWVTELAKEEKGICGIVSWAPLEKGEKVRCDLAELYKNKLVKGIRRIIQYEEDIEFCLNPDFIKGVQVLEEYKFSFDLCIKHTQLPNAIKFVKQCPDVRFVLDHIGKPDIKSNIMEPWATHIRQLAKMNNIYCKISGLVTEADHQKWTQNDLEPYIYHVLDCFGPDRVMFGGDWPVIRQAAEYSSWFAVLSKVVQGFLYDDLHKLFYANAVDFYRL